MDIHQRLAEFFKRLEAAPPASNANEALALICRLIEEVEDELYPFPRENPPPRLRFTGRMYAPQRDRISSLKGGGLVAETRGHLIFCQPNGGIRIENADDGAIALTKDGKER